MEENQTIGKQDRRLKEARCGDATIYGIVYLVDFQ